MVAQTESDARILMLTHPKAFDVVDLDPYGTPSQLLEPAVEAVADGGLLCVTATDTAVLCGNNSGPSVHFRASIASIASPCAKLGYRCCWAGWGIFCRGLLGQVRLDSSQRRLLPRIRPPHGLADDSCCGGQAAQADSAGALGVRRLLHPNICPRLLVAKSERCIYIYTCACVWVAPTLLPADALQETKDLPLKLAYVCQSTGCKSYYLQPVGKASTKEDGTVKRKPGSLKTPPEGCNQTDSQVSQRHTHFFSLSLSVSRAREW